MVDVDVADVATAPSNGAHCIVFVFEASDIRPTSDAHGRPADGELQSCSWSVKQHHPTRRSMSRLPEVT